MKSSRGAIYAIGVAATHIALTGAIAWTLRQIGRAVTDLRVDDDYDEFNEDDFVEVDRPVANDDPNERQLDPAVLRWMREQDCGVVVNVVTGIARREPQLPMMTIVLDTSELDWDALRQFHTDRIEREVGERQPSEAPMPAGLTKLADELFGPQFASELFGPNGPLAGVASDDAREPASEPIETAIARHEDVEGHPADVTNTTNVDGGSETSSAPETELSDGSRE